MKIYVVAALFLGLSQPVLAADEIILGRWCDEMIPNMPELNTILTIVYKTEGKVTLNAEYGDGSSGVYDLRETNRRGEFEKIGSSHGDKYRIVSSTGALQLLDNEGLIRTAKRLENTPKGGEC